MEIVILLFFLAIFIGAMFLGGLIFIFYKRTQRRKKAQRDSAKESN